MRVIGWCFSLISSVHSMSTYCGPGWRLGGIQKGPRYGPCFPESCCLKNSIVVIIMAKMLNARYSFKYFICSDSSNSQRWFETGTTITPVGELGKQANLTKFVHAVRHTVGIWAPNHSLTRGHVLITTFYCPSTHLHHSPRCPFYQPCSACLPVLPCILECQF